MTQTVIEKILAWKEAVRIPLWTKSFWVFFPLLGTNNLTLTLFLRLIPVFFLVTTLSVIVYINNDINDSHFDAQHPTKKFRPFARGSLTEDEGRVGMMVGLALVAVLLGIIGDAVYVLFSLWFVFSNVLYTQRIKKIPYLEFIFYCFVYPLRFWMGAYIVQSPMFWLVSILIMSRAARTLIFLRAIELRWYGRESRMVLAYYTSRGLQILLVIAELIMAIALGFLLLRFSQLFIISFLLSLWCDINLLKYAFVMPKQKANFDEIEKIVKNDYWGFRSTLALVLSLFGISAYLLINTLH